MASLISLPYFLVHDLLTGWLQLQHIGRLDEAYGQQSLRASFLSVTYADRNAYHAEDCFDILYSNWRQRILHIDPIDRHFEYGGDILLRWAAARRACLREISITSMFHKNNTLRLNLLVRSGNYVEKIVNWDSYLSNSMEMGTLMDIAEYCPNLNWLVCGLNFKEHSFETIGAACPQIRHLAVFAKSMAQGTPRITSFCKALKSMQVTSFIEGVVTEEWWETFLANCGSNLESLRGVVVADGGAAGTLRRIAQHCPILRELEIGSKFHSAGISDLRTAWEDVIDRCSNLQSVKFLGASYSFLAVAASDIGERLQCLHFLADFARDGGDIETCVHTCTNLRSLAIKDLNGVIDNETCKTIAETCQHMEELNIHYMCPWQVTDTAAFALAGACHKLTYLALPGSGVTDAGLIALMTVNPGLVHLDMEGCKGITDTSMRAVPLLCVHMVHLNVHLCPVKMDGIHAVLQGCRLLRYFNVPSHQFKKTSAGLAAGQYSHIFRPGLVVEANAAILWSKLKEWWPAQPGVNECSWGGGEGDSFGDEDLSEY